MNMSVKHVNQIKYSDKKKAAPISIYTYIKYILYISYTHYVGGSI